MMVYINDQPYALEHSQTLNDLLNSLRIDTSKGMAVAVNNNVVPREKWDVQQVNDNDKILLIKAAQGG